MRLNYCLILQRATIVPGIRLQYEHTAARNSSSTRLRYKDAAVRISSSVNLTVFFI